MEGKKKGSFGLTSLPIPFFFPLLFTEQLIQFKDNEYEVTTATTVEEAKTVLSAGFEYVTEKNRIMVFRKPKRFVSLEI